MLVLVQVTLQVLNIVEDEVGIPLLEGRCCTLLLRYPSSMLEQILLVILENTRHVAFVLLLILHGERDVLQRGIVQVLRCR